MQIGFDQEHLPRRFPSICCSRTPIYRQTTSVWNQSLGAPGSPLCPQKKLIRKLSYTIPDRISSSTVTAGPNRLLPADRVLSHAGCRYVLPYRTTRIGRTHASIHCATLQGRASYYGSVPKKEKLDKAPVEKCPLIT